MLSKAQLKSRIQILIVFFIFGLVLSGITAFPIETQLSWIASPNNLFSGGFQDFIDKAYEGIKYNNNNYPMISYGTDWLAFAHLVIAMVFIGPLKDPVKNIWVIEFGMLACIAVFPLALIAGSIRDIPMFWRILDCSFGLIGIIPLSICRKYIKQLEVKENESPL